MLSESKGMVTLASYDWGKGKGIYLPSFEMSQENTRLLFNIIRFAGNELSETKYITDNLYTECAYYPERKILVVINNSGQKQITAIDTEFGKQSVELEPYDTVILNLDK